ncbi:hypothetical protein MMC20_006574 [Loxospora ochrophaea]|nr:hypothetical protein [Loxospora ochrophaea]
MDSGEKSGVCHYVEYYGPCGHLQRKTQNHYCLGRNHSWAFMCPIEAMQEHVEVKRVAEPVGPWGCFECLKDQTLFEEEMKIKNDRTCLKWLQGVEEGHDPNILPETPADFWHGPWRRAQQSLQFGQMTQPHSNEQTGPTPRRNEVPKR